MKQKYKLYNKTEKATSGCAYWGDYTGENSIDISLSSGIVNINEEMPHDLLHSYNRNQYFLVLSGSGTIEINGKEVAVSKEQVLCIQSGTRHRMLKAIEKPFS